MKNSFLLGLFLLVLLFAGYAYATPSHDIMQKIASESLVEVSGVQPCAFSLPSSWTVHRSSAERISFTVPYHAGVMGVVESQTDDISLDQAVKHVEEAFKSEFVVLEQANIEQNGVKGTRAVVSGRLGGEIWKLVIFTGRVSPEKRVLYYAAAPERWFEAYSLLFDDSLKSMH